MEFRILGPLEVWRDGHRVVIGPPRARSLLVILLLHPNEVLARDDLIDRLWDERPPETAKAMLQNAVSALRRTVGADTLETVPPGYRLNVEPANLDSLRFQALLDQARDADPEVRAERLRDALATWRGAPLSDYPIVEGELVHLEELRLFAIEQRVDVDLELGRAAELVPELEELLASAPLRERFWEQLMLALYRSGRQSEGLDAYRRAHAIFGDRLGIEPGPRLKELQRAILVQDPALDAAAFASLDMFERAAPVLPGWYAERAHVLHDYGVAVFRLGERSRALALLKLAAEEARLAGDAGLEEVIRLAVSEQRNRAGERSVQDHFAQTEQSIELFEREGDHRWLAKALLSRGIALGDMGAAAKGEDDLLRAIELARETSDRWQEGWSKNLLAISIWCRGPAPVEVTLERCVEQLASFDWRPPGPLGLWATRGYLNAQAGHPEEALTWGRRAVDTTRKAGLRSELAVVRRRLAAILMLNGDDAGAEDELRATQDLLASIAPDDPWLTRARAELAALLCRRDEVEEAEALVNAARRAVRDDLESQIRLPIAGALVAARRGQKSVALQLATEAVELASETDWLDLHSEALEILALVGGPSSAFEDALRLATLRGNVVAAARIQAALV